MSDARYEYTIVVFPDDMAACPYTVVGHNPAYILTDYVAWENGEVYEYFIERLDLQTGEWDAGWAAAVAFYSIDAAVAHALSVIPLEGATSKTARIIIHT
jgi:hypothetical protein